MIYGSVCSGIEAATVAWHPMGWKPMWFSEIDAFPSRVLEHHYPEVENLGDMTRIFGHRTFRLNSIDLLVGGTPCQSFSVAGLRKGLADPRGNLTLVYLAIASRARPRWLVWENVPGVLSDDGGRTFGAFLGGLGQLGYGVAYRVLNAQFFGVPQRRRRVFVVGYLGDWRRAAAVLFERHSLSGYPPPSRASGQDVTGTLAARTGAGGGLGTDFECSGGLIPEVGRCLTSRNARNDGETETFIPDVSVTLLAKQNLSHDNTQDTLIAHTLRGEGFDASEDGTGRGTPLVPIAFDTTQITSAENRSRPEPGDPCHPLAAASAVAMPQVGVRRLTPRECERLQGFPDDYTLIPKAVDGPRYRALGNSMAVPVMRWIGERIAKVEAVR